MKGSGDGGILFPLFVREQAGGSEMERTDQAKQRYGLIGFGTEHSLSPALHARIGDYPYDLLEVHSEEQLREVLKREEYGGFNVTHPYKETVMKYLDELEDTAAVVGAVNTIRRLPSGALRGYNTDVDGAASLFAPGFLKGTRVVILGTGGAALAMREAAHRSGAEEIVLVSRDPEAAKKRIQCGTEAGRRSRVVSWEDREAYLDAEILIQATPIGMSPQAADRSILGEHGLAVTDFGQLKAAADMIYHPHRTLFLQEAEAAGAETVNGLKMLIVQGIRAAEIWTEEKLPEEDILREALTELRMERLPILLVGMPGSGKSQIGKQLAKECHRRFIDLDKATSLLAGCAPSEMIRKYGEERFRETETETLRQVLNGEPYVLAAGGGTVLREENRRLLRREGLVLYLDRDPAKLATKGRPLSQQRGTEALYDERRPLYLETADAVVDNNRNLGEGFDKFTRKLLQNKRLSERERSQSAYVRDLRSFGKRLKRIVRKELRMMAEQELRGLGGSPENDESAE